MPAVPYLEGADLLTKEHHSAADEHFHITFKLQWKTAQYFMKDAPLTPNRMPSTHWPKGLNKG